MTHDDMAELLPGYVLGALDQAEREHVADHLRVCLPCQIAAESDRIIVEQLAFAAPRRCPSQEVRARVLAHAEREAERDGQRRGAAPRRTGSRLPWEAVRQVPRWLLAAALVPWLAVAGLGAATWFAVQDKPSHTLEIDRLSGPTGESGQLAGLPSQSTAVLMLAHLPALRPSQVYVCWFERHGAMERVAAFNAVRKSDDATVVLHLPYAMSSYSAIDITMEPRATTRHPTGTLLARGTL